MTKVMFDTQIFDRILETSLINRLIELKSKRDVEYLITHVQIDEISAIPVDKIDERQMLFLLVLHLQPRVIQTEGAFFGVSRFGVSKFTKDAHIRILDAHIRILDFMFTPRLLYECLTCRS